MRVFLLLHFSKLLEILRSMYNSSNLLIILVILKRVLCDMTEFAEMRGERESRSFLFNDDINFNYLSRMQV